MNALRQTFRQLWRRRSTTALSVGLLTLGVGLSVSFYSVLDSALLRGLPFPDGDRLVAFSTQEAPGWPMPLDDYREIAEVQRSFEWTLPLRTFTAVVTRGDRTKGLIGSYVPAALFEQLEVEPLLGRRFTAEDEDPASPPVALISHRLWQGSYGADPGILGEVITLNREPSVVVGVMPPGFHFPLRHDVWGVFGRPGREWEASPVFGIGKLARGSTVSLARQDLERMVALLDASRPIADDRTAALDTYVRANIGDRAQGALRAMVFAALGLLALTCANLAILRLGESLRRAAELDTRLALGSGRFGLVKLLLLENLVLGLAAAALGVALAFGLIETVGKSLLRGGYLERIFWIDARLDLRAASFAAACALAASLLGALAPIGSALSRARFQRLGAAGASRAFSAPWSRGLVSLQVGLCFALLVAAGVWSARVHELLSAEPGFASDGLASVRLSLYQAEIREPTERRALLDRLMRELHETPGVLGAAYATSAPWGYIPRFPVAASAHEPDRDTAPTAEVLEVSPAFFATLGLDLQAGRGFAPTDSDGGNVAIISRGLADRLFGLEVLDRVLTIGGRQRDEPPRQPRIIGIAADLDLDHSEEPDRNLTVYLPAAAEGTFVFIRQQPGPRTSGELLEGVLARTAPRVGILEETTVEEALASSLWVERRLGQIFSFFAIAALLLTAGGVYAVIAFMVSSRERELGIRAAIGARPRDLQWLVLGESARQLLLGLVAGAGAVWAGARLLDQALVEGLEIQPAILVAAAGVVALGSLAGSWSPTRKAARADPTRCLDAQ